eukprot:scaffold1583_cov105-Isochrysis_galbana.AAC.6
MSYAFSPVFSRISSQAEGSVTDMRTHAGGDRSGCGPAAKPSASAHSCISSGSKGSTRLVPFATIFLARTPGNLEISNSGGTAIP